MKFINLYLKEIVKISTIQEAESFMLKHGENIVDRVGAEIDRIERNLRVYLNNYFSSNKLNYIYSFFVKKKYPDIQHVDLEVL